MSDSGFVAAVDDSILEWERRRQAAMNRALYDDGRIYFTPLSADQQDRADVLNDLTRSWRAQPVATAAGGGAITYEMLRTALDQQMRQRAEEQWRANTAFLRGGHWFDWNDINPPLHPDLVMDPGL